MANHVLTILLTGGPGGGKSGLIEQLAGQTVICGRTVVTVDETASKLKRAFAAEGRACRSADLALQRRIIEQQFTSERAALKHAHSLARSALVVLDRGVFDSVGFVGDVVYRQLLVGQGLTATEVLARYDAVLFMKSAAHYAPWEAERFTRPTADVFRKHVRDVEHRISQHVSHHPRVWTIEPQPDAQLKIELALSMLQRIAYWLSRDSRHNAISV